MATGAAGAAGRLGRGALKRRPGPSLQSDQVFAQAADAAAATSYLYRSAVERFDAIVTDAAGKPLAVVGGFKGAEPMDGEAFWDVPCEILIAAALEGQITKDNAGQIKAKLVIEGANGPTTTEADDILHDKGVLVLPDVIANAGGVTVSYFEWVQDFSSFFWSEDDINTRLVRIMREAFAAIWQVADEHRVSLRTATFIVACTRILQARELRGLYP